MVLRAVASGFTVALLLSAALLCAPRSRPRSTPATGTVFATIDDVDSGQPLSNVHLKVQLFRPEPPERKFSPLLCVPSDNARPRFTFALTTGPDGSFNLTAPAGGYLAKISIPQRQPIFGCISFGTEEQMRKCSGFPASRPAPHLPLYIRTTNSIPGFSVTSWIVGFVPQLCPLLANGSKLPTS
jgi:hypothetical protein